MNAAHFYRSGPVAPIELSSTDPQAYHDACRDRTIEVIKKNLLTPSPGKRWSDYWAPGSYGPNDDIFSKRYPKTPEAEEALLVNQLSQARDYGAGFLLAVSKALPSFVKNLRSEVEPRDDGLYNVKLEFVVLENRKPEMTLFIQTEGGELLQGTDLIEGRSEKLEKGEVLPWAKSFSMKWGMRAVPGSQLTLKIVARDADGNYSVPGITTLKFKKNLSLENINFN